MSPSLSNSWDAVTSLDVFTHNMSLLNSDIKIINKLVGTVGTQTGVFVRLATSVVN